MNQRIVKLNKGMARNLEECASTLLKKAEKDQSKELFLRQLAAAAVLKGSYSEAIQYVGMIQDEGKELSSLESLLEYSLSLEKP